MIQVENLVKTFDGFRALDGADFHVKKGAIYGLVGPNGAGKSTLIRHLTGIYKQDEGSVLIDGQGFSFYRFYLLHIYTFCVLRLQVLFLNSSYRHDHKPLIKKRKKSLSVLWAALWN